ncbi:DUF2478 domain-containing protein [uncultured Rhodospira sp.]|uniref:DUF2478 domain-containing protein n=1 Tax=uncultured Rhodospira sp. TaxID=1936189 RepID=UPI002609B045|nr:DUF2478 domain-containing protein [uncultured Rhodospira sp.]
MSAPTLGYVLNETRGAADRLLAAVAVDLQRDGARVAGVVQHNTERTDSTVCDMDVRVLPDGPVVRISQWRGAHARGCRLDADALEAAVVAVAGRLVRRPDILILNKFGKHEAEGHGFRHLIGEALCLGIPVLLGVNGLNLDAFLSFAGGIETRLPADRHALRTWAVAATRGQPVPAPA